MNKERNSTLFKNFFTINDLISTANEVTSLVEARRRLGMSIRNFKKFASFYKDEETGLSYYDLIFQRKNKGNLKKKKDLELKNKLKVKPLDLKLIVDGYKRNSLSDNEFRFYLISNGYKEQKCETCGYKEFRTIDYRVPLKLIFKDGKKSNGKLDNLEFICYNCHFINYPDYKKDEEVVYENSVNKISVYNGEDKRIHDTSIDINSFEEELKKIKMQPSKSIEDFEFVKNKNYL